MYGMVQPLQRPIVASRYANLFLYCKRLSIKQKIPLRFYTSETIFFCSFFPLADATAVNRGRIPRQKLGNTICFLIRISSDRHDFSFSHKQDHHFIIIMDAICPNINWPPPFSQSHWEKKIPNFYLARHFK